MPNYCSIFLIYQEKNSLLFDEIYEKKTNNIFFITLKKTGLSSSASTSSSTSSTLLNNALNSYLNQRPLSSNSIHSIQSITNTNLNHPPPPPPSHHHQGAIDCSNRLNLVSINEHQRLQLTNISRSNVGVCPSLQSSSLSSINNEQTGKMFEQLLFEIIVKMKKKWNEIFK